jgi:hypothetical protein
MGAGTLFITMGSGPHWKPKPALVLSGGEIEK